MKMKKILQIFIFCLTPLLGVGSEELILSDILANTMEQIKKFNDQIKIATETLDQMDNVNKTLDSIDNLILNSGEKIFNPAKSFAGIVGKIQNLQKRFEEYPDKYKKVFSYERFFKDYHTITCRTEYTTKENEEFQKIHKTTGIKIEELKARQCIEDNLTGKLTSQQKEALKNALALIQQGKFDNAIEHIQKFENERLVKMESINSEIVTSQRMLDDIYLAYASKGKNGQTEIERMSDELKDKLKDWSKREKPDLLQTQMDSNFLLLGIYQVLMKIYTAQVQFYNASQKLEMALNAKALLTSDEIQAIKNGNKTTNSYLEELMKNPKMQYDAIGLPKF